MSFVTVRCGWSLRPSGIAVRSGRRSRRWPKSRARRRSRCTSGCVASRSMRAAVGASLGGAEGPSGGGERYVRWVGSAGHVALGGGTYVAGELVVVAVCVEGVGAEDSVMSVYLQRGQPILRATWIPLFVTDRNLRRHAARRGAHSVAPEHLAALLVPTDAAQSRPEPIRDGAIERPLRSVSASRAVSHTPTWWGSCGCSACVGVA